MALSRWSWRTSLPRSPGSRVALPWGQILDSETLSIQALGHHSPHPDRVANGMSGWGWPVASSDSWVGELWGPQWGEARPSMSQEFQTETHACIFLRNPLISVTCVLQPARPSCPARGPFPLGHLLAGRQEPCLPCSQPLQFPE